jgi:hypothetical protein
VRPDIAKVITERPRAGGDDSYSAAYRRGVDWATLLEEGREEDSPLREHLRRKWGHRKRFTDFLTPISGFLRQSVGRAWDDVWSELSAHLSSGSTIQRHVLGHVLDFVEIHAVEQEDGSMTDSRGRALRGFRSQSYYVHPESGLLCEAPKVRRPARRALPQRFPLVPYHRLNGVWYEVGFARLRKLLVLMADGPVSTFKPAFDIVFKRLTSVRHNHAPGSHWLDGGVFYCASKRQIGKRELKRLDLRTAVSDHAGTAFKA